MVTAEYYKELQESMAARSVESLIEEFNQQVGKRSWTSVRGLHDTVLVETLVAKGIDMSLVYDGVVISFNRKIKLNPDKRQIIFA